VSKRTGIILGAVAAIAVIVAIVAVAAGGGDDDSAVSTDQTATTSTLAPVTNGGGSGGGGNSNGGQSSGGGGGPTGPQPTIASFTTLSGNQDVDCHNGNSQNFSATWDTTDAVRVAISGGDSNLPPDGETSLPFECLSAPHTYTLTAYGSGGKTATRSLTLPARNVQPPDSGDQDNQ
jgi:hypothetical protein